jgi:hypothetical protein
MAIEIIEARGPARVKLSSGANTAKVKYSSVIATITNKDTEDTITVIHLPPLGTNLKKPTNKLLTRFLSTITKGARSQTTNDVTNLEDIVLGPATFLRPLEYKMEPRPEPNIRRFVRPKAIRQHEPIPLDDPADMGKLTVHYHRDRAQKILTGQASRDLTPTDLVHLLVQHGSPELDRETGEFHGGETEQRTAKYIEGMIEHLAVNWADDENSVPLWREYISCYIMVSSC